MEPLIRTTPKEAIQSRVLTHLEVSTFRNVDEKATVPNNI